MSDSSLSPPGDGDEEADLFQAIRFGNDDAVRQAVEELVRRYGSRLLEWLGVLGLTPSERDDVASTAWLRAWTKIKRFQYRADGKFFAWLKTIARNVALETFRKRFAPPASSGAFEKLDDNETADRGTDDGLVLLLRRDFRAAAEAVLAGAPADYRALIEAHFFNDTRLADVQERLGWTRSKVDVTKLRALAWLRKQLTDQYGERFVQEWLV